MLGLEQLELALLERLAALEQEQPAPVLVDLGQLAAVAGDAGLVRLARAVGRGDVIDDLEIDAGAEVVAIDHAVPVGHRLAPPGRQHRDDEGGKPDDADPHQHSTAAQAAEKRFLPGRALAAIPLRQTRQLLDGSKHKGWSPGRERAVAAGSRSACRAGPVHRSRPAGGTYYRQQRANSRSASCAAYHPRKP